MNYLEIANSPAMWLACFPMVAIILCQSLIFTKKSLKMGKKIGVEDAQIKRAIRSSATASIGPSLVILAGMLSLLVSMGGPISWIRLSAIGSVAYELMAAGFAAEAAGVTLGGPDMTAEVFATGIWVMTLGSIGWILFTALCTPQLDKFRTVLAGGKKAFIPVVSAAAMCGAFSYLCIERVVRFDTQTISAVSGFAIMIAFLLYNKKAQKQWVKEWGFTIAMFAGMVIAIPFIL